MSRGPPAPCGKRLNAMNGSNGQCGKECALATNAGPPPPPEAPRTQRHGAPGGRGGSRRPLEGSHSGEPFALRLAPRL
eukprot:462758-Prymnesium_polylepis.1